MELDHWAGDLFSAGTRRGKALVSENKQFKNLEDALNCVTSVTTRKII